MTDPSPLTVEQLAEAIARLFHLRYERLGPAFGWESQESARGKDFDELPESNRRLMIATVRSLLESGVIEPGPAVLDTFREVAQPGDWIVADDSGAVERVEPERFGEEFRRAD